MASAEGVASLEVAPEEEVTAEVEEEAEEEETFNSKALLRKLKNSPLSHTPVAVNLSSKPLEKTLLFYYPSHYFTLGPKILQVHVHRIKISGWKG